MSGPDLQGPASLRRSRSPAGSKRVCRASFAVGDVRVRSVNAWPPRWVRLDRDPTLVPSRAGGLSRDQRRFPKDLFPVQFPPSCHLADSFFHRSCRDRSRVFDRDGLCGRRRSASPSCGAPGPWSSFEIILPETRLKHRSGSSLNLFCSKGERSR